MRFGILHILTLMAVAASACKSRSTESKPDFVGGKRAAEGQFPATLALADCTAAKYTDRHIVTAAHCVVDMRTARLRSEYQAGATLRVAIGPEATSGTFELPVKRSFVHQSFAKGAQEGDAAVKRGLVNAIADLAVIEVCPDANVTPDCRRFQEVTNVHLPLEEKTWIPVHKGRSIVVGGYGAESEPSLEQRFLGDGIALTPEPAAERGGARRLNFAVTEVVERREFMAAFPYRYQEVDTGYRVENVPMFGLGNGDSGGPVYLDDRLAGRDPTGHVYLKVVGVNSYTSRDQSHFTVIDFREGQRPGDCLRQLLLGRDAGFKLDGSLPTFCNF